MWFRFTSLFILVYSLWLSVYILEYWLIMKHKLSHPVVKANVFLNMYLRNRENKHRALKFELQLNSKYISDEEHRCLWHTVTKVILCFVVTVFLNPGNPSDKRFFKGSYSSGMVEKSLRIRKWFVSQLFSTLCSDEGMFTLQYVFCSVCKNSFGSFSSYSKQSHFTFAAAGVAVLHWLLYVMHTSQSWCNKSLTKELLSVR